MTSLSKLYFNLVSDFAQNDIQALFIGTVRKKSGRRNRYHHHKGNQQKQDGLQSHMDFLVIFIIFQSLTTT